MQNIRDPRHFQHFLEIVGSLFNRRDRILNSGNQLKDYSYFLEECSECELNEVRRKINTEVYAIISDINVLAPILSNPEIINIINEKALKLSSSLEFLGSDVEYRNIIAQIIRGDFCPIVLMTQLELTPKNIKKAYGVEIGVKDVVHLKGYFEHHQDNY